MSRVDLCYTVCAICDIRIDVPRLSVLDQYRRIQICSDDCLSKFRYDQEEARKREYKDSMLKITVEDVEWNEVSVIFCKVCKKIYRVENFKASPKRKDRACPDCENKDKK